MKVFNLKLNACFVEEHVDVRGEGDPEEDVFAADLLSSGGEAEGDPFQHPVSLLKEEFEVVFADDFGGPDLHRVAIEDRVGIFVAKRFEEVE